MGHEMMVGIWDASGETFVVDFDSISAIIHPMAAVAWDRDCHDIVLRDGAAGGFGARQEYWSCGLRFCQDGSRWAACTGMMIPTGGRTTVAIWDDENLRWERRT